VESRSIDAILADAAKPRAGEARSARPAAGESSGPLLALCEENITNVRKRKRNGIVPIEEYLRTDPRTRTHVPGDLHMERVTKNLSKLGEPHGFSSQQEDYLEPWKAVMTPLVYGPDFDRARTRLLREAGELSFPKLAMMMTWRQFGKSTVNARGFASAMVSMRRKNGAIMSARMQNTRQFIADVKAAVLKIAPDRFLGGTKDECVVASADANMAYGKKMLIARGDVNVLRGLSNSEKNKGITPDYLMIDETSLVHPKVVSELVAPLVKRGTRVFMASTNRGDDNHYSERFNQEETEGNKPLVVKKFFGLLCEECDGDEEKMLKCRHNDWVLPPWNIAQNAELAQSLIPDTGTYLREVLNVITKTADGCVFGTDILEQLKARPRTAVLRKPGDILYTFIDPAGGGKSDWAVVTFLRDARGSVVVTGLHSFNTMEGPVIRKNITNYALVTSRHPVYGTMPHRVMTEQNYGGHPVAGDCCEILTRLIPFAQEFRSKAVGHGVVTGDKLKEKAVGMMSVLLQADCVSFAEDIVSGEPQRTPTFLRELHVQLSRIRCIKGKWTGKVDATGKPANDDLGMGLILGVYNSARCATLEQRLDPHLFQHFLR
jgi:hypothetical protein